MYQHVYVDLSTDVCMKAFEFFLTITIQFSGMHNAIFREELSVVRAFLEYSL